MDEKVIRTKTKYKNIYYNENTKKYDIKYNYKVYDPLTQKNKYKAKWVYNLLTVAEAKQELAKLQTGTNKAEDKDITLRGAHELWKNKAQAQNYSAITLRNTKQDLKMLSQFISLDTKIKDITEDVYYKVFGDVRAHGYSGETIYSMNATFRKLINLSYKKRLISDNPLNRTENIKTKKKEKIRILTNDEWEKLDTHFNNTQFVRLGIDRYKKFRFMFNVLYYTGIRIGECLALTWQDFEEFNYYSEKDEQPLRLAGTKATDNEHLSGMRLRVTKALADGTIKGTKNSKPRTVPLSPIVERLYWKNYNAHIERGGKPTERIFNYTYSNCLDQITKACKKVNIEHCSCHDFRHTFISNMIRKNVPLPVIEKVSGDTQETIFKRYSHMFEQDEVLVLKALENL